MTAIYETDKEANDQNTETPHSLVKCTQVVEGCYFILLNHNYGNASGGFKKEVTPDDLLSELACKYYPSKEQALLSLRRTNRLLTELSQHNANETNVNPVEPQVLVASLQMLADLPLVLLEGKHVQSHNGELTKRPRVWQIKAELALRQRADSQKIDKAIQVAQGFFGNILKYI